MWSVLENIPCTLKKNVFCLFFPAMEYPVDNKSNSSILFFRISAALLIFCLDDISTHVSGALKSPTITVLLPISPFVSVIICFIYRCSWIGCIYVNKGNILFLYHTFYHYIMPVFVFHHGPCYKAYFFWNEYCYSCFLVISVCMKYLTQPLTLSPLLKGVFCRQHIDGSCFLSNQPPMSFDQKI